MEAFFVHNREQDLDYIVIPDRAAVAVTPKVLSDFLYESKGFADWKGERDPKEVGPPEAYGKVVASREGDQLRILDAELWHERRELYE
jgi:hypothetical protein